MMILWLVAGIVAVTITLRFSDNDIDSCPYSSIVYIVILFHHYDAFYLFVQCCVTLFTVTHTVDLYVSWKQLLQVLTVQPRPKGEVCTLMFAHLLGMAGVIARRHTFPDC